jgi:hypothetical protein
MAKAKRIEVAYEEDGAFRSTYGRKFTKAQVERVLSMRAKGTACTAIDAAVFDAKPGTNRGWISWQILKSIPGAWDAKATTKARAQAKAAKASTAKKS